MAATAIKNRTVILTDRPLRSASLLSIKYHHAPSSMTQSLPRPSIRWLRMWRRRFVAEGGAAHGGPLVCDVVVTEWRYSYMLPHSS